VFDSWAELVVDSLDNEVTALVWIDYARLHLYWEASVLLTPFFYSPSGRASKRMALCQGDGSSISECATVCAGPEHKQPVAGEDGRYIWVLGKD
jgi:hypothetical protein